MEDKNLFNAFLDVIKTYDNFKEITLEPNEPYEAEGLGLEFGEKRIIRGSSIDADYSSICNSFITIITKVKFILFADDDVNSNNEVVKKQLAIVLFNEDIGDEHCELTHYFVRSKDDLDYNKIKEFFNKCLLDIFDESNFSLDNQNLLEFIENVNNKYREIDLLEKIDIKEETKQRKKI